MKIGDWEVNEIFTCLYFANNIIFILAWVIVVLWMIILFKKEMKESYIDLLRTIQYVFIFVWYCYSIQFVLRNFWYKQTDYTIINIIDSALESIIKYYYILNLITWYLLMHQIMILHQLRNGCRYSKWK